MMGYSLKQSQTARPLLFKLRQSADHVSALTGASPTVVISKNGAPFASPAGAVSEVGSGWYQVAANATDTNTLGALLLYATAGSADPTDEVFEIVAYDPDNAVRLGLTSLPNAAADAAGGLPISDAGGLDLDAKLANTNEITAARMGALTDWINGGRLDLLLDSVVADSEAASTQIAAIATKLGGITLLKNWLALIMGKAADTTTRAEVNATTAGATFNETTDSLEAIRDRGDAAWTTGSGGGGGSTDWTANERTAIRTILGIPGSGTTPADPSDGVLYDIKQKTDQIGSAGAITNLLAGAVLDPGTITSFPSELVIGDSYQETDGREIQIPLVDTDGNVLTTVGSRNLADATATFEIRRINESDSTRVITGVATIVDPPGTGTTTALGAPYAIVELPADETAKGLVSYRYRGKLTLTWSGPGTDVYSFDTETIKFTY